MSRNWKVKSRWLGGLFLTAAATLAQAAIPATPGMVNYVEGQVRLDGRTLTTRSAGSAELAPNQVLSTDHGKAEILLTPGVFLRMGDNSAVRMVSPELTNTQVEVLNGEAMVEVTQLFKGNNITVLDHGATTRLEKNGLYAFKAAPAEVAVYDGKAEVLANDRQVTLKKGKELFLDGDLRAQSFDTKHQDELFTWSNLRSEYSAEASLASARTIVVNGGWWGPGWYWNPYWGMYSFVPNGLLYSPFGWGFYSPSVVYWAPVYRPRYHPFVGRAVAPPVVRPGVAAPAPRSGFSRSPGIARGGFGGGARHR
jgi:hypothetical protein